jgi:O-antigen/teichoic acid export membrane protein
MISRSFLKTGSIVILGNGAVALIGIAALRIYTELAPAEVFGAANLVLGALALGAQLFLQPIASTQLRYHTEAAQAGEGDSFSREVLRWQLAAAAVLSVVACGVLTAWSLVGTEHLGPVMLAAAVTWVFASALRNVLMCRLHAEQRMTSYMMLRVAETLLAVLATSTALAIVARAESFVWGQALGLAALVAVIGVVAPWPGWRLASGGRASADFLEKLRRYGAPFMPMALLFWLSGLADRYILAGLISTAAAGQYLAAFTIAAAGFGLANGAMGDLFRPKLFDAENAGDHARAQHVFLAWLAMYAVISLCGLAAIALLGDWLVALVLAEAYREGAVTIMLWIGFGYAINGLTTAFENRVFSLGHSGRVLWPLGVGAVGNIVLSYLLIPWLGVVGAAVASCLGFGVRFASTAVVLRLVLKERL